MGLKDVLERMKLVEVEGGEADRAPAPAPPPLPSSAANRRPPPAPKTSIKEILQTAPPPPKIDEQALQKEAGDEIPDFALIYRTSGVKDPPHGFSAYKVLEILSSADFASLDPRAKAAALSGFLRMNPTGPVPIADVIQDAVARDHALDNFERFLQKKLESLKEQLEKENGVLQTEIDVLTHRNQERMAANRATLDKERQRLADWQARKRIEERKLFDAVGPFVEHNPVSLGSAPDTPGPAPSKG